MPNASGAGNHGVEGVEIRNADDADIRHPDDQDQPDEGPAMSGTGAMPSGSAMDHWATALPSADATKPDTMPTTDSTPLPGESEERAAV